MGTAAEKTSLAGVQPWVYASGAMKPLVPHCEDQNLRTSAFPLKYSRNSKYHVAILVLQVAGKGFIRSTK
jgi:hypothetical protein